MGNSVSQDLEYLGLSRYKNRIEDISQYEYFRKFANGKTPGLRAPSKEFLNYDIQLGSHSLVEDAQAAMALFRLHEYLEKLKEIK